jgi:hypothetical protein
MASSATNHNPGGVARVIHAIFPTRRWALVLVTTDVALGLGLAPIWAHVAAGTLLHPVAHVCA